MAAARCPALSSPGSAAAIEALAQACSSCQRCSLAQGRQRVVYARGNAAARLMLIGEAPGAQEDASGLPFVGRSGQLLDQLLARAGLDSQRDLWITNVVKCRPPGNRRPSTAELAACRPWLDQQIAQQDPALILLLGATAVQAVLGHKGAMAALRGRWQPWQGRWLMPIFHPSYLLRFASEQAGSPRSLTLEDLQQVRKRLLQLPAPGTLPEPGPIPRLL
jgi:uracil-DNA glycosylase